ncbi:CheR family methyltransferase [Mongoliitalea lutea]|uniref:CheR family methyltransferase n=1 Tax=Mongoliitalea lutea TaxID=849756 RepID=UPI0035EDD083
MAQESLNNPKKIVNIVVIGASAGGLEAIQEFLANFPYVDDTCLIIAQHLSPSHKSMLVQLLAKSTSMTIREAVDGTFLEVDHIYVTPPDRNIFLENKRIRLSKPSNAIGPKPSVDELLSSLYQSDFNKIVAVILSGTGKDGSVGLKLLKNRPCLALAQSPATAKYDGMPQAAIQTGVIDEILDPKSMGKFIKKYLSGELEDEEEDDYEITQIDYMDQLFRILSKRTGTDFSNYKKATIQRRLLKRMNELAISRIENYLPILEKDSDEQDIMFNKILIGVTKFFRDQEAFETLKEYLEELVNHKKPNDTIRIWVPGCSTGEEPLSLAFLLQDILDAKQKPLNIQIFATDIDDMAIQFARSAVFTENSIQELPQELVSKYFVKSDKGDYEVVKNIRSMILFSKHDLINQPPFLKLDLISCRNLLIYFNTTLQNHVIPIFHYALNPDGLLFLGKSENIQKK